MFSKPLLRFFFGGAMIVALGMLPSASAQPAKEPTVKLEVGSWKYDYAIRAWGTRSEGEWGVLTHAGKQLDPLTLPALEVNDYVHTPWGTFYWGGHAKYPFGAHGWFPTPAKAKKAGHRIVPPDTPATECVLAEADDGTTVRIAVGTRVHLMLPESRLWERAWKQGDLGSDSLRAVGQPLDRRSPLPLGWGPGAWVHYAFQAEKPGTATLAFESQPAPNSIKKVRITIVVAPAEAPPMPGNTADVSLPSTMPNARVTMTPGGTLKVHVTLAGGTGYKLHWDNPPAGTATLMGDPKVEGPTSAKLGAPSIYHYEFRIGATPPAEFRLVCRLLRPGQATGPEYGVVVTVPDGVRK